MKRIEIKKNWLYLDIEDENETWNGLQVSPTLMFSEDISYEEKKYFDNPEYAYNKNQTWFRIKLDSYESQSEVFLYLYKKGWKNLRLERIEDYGRAYRKFDTLKKSYSKSNVHFCQGFYERNDILITLTRKELKQFKQDIMSIPGYKNVWILEDHKISETFLIR